MDPRLGIAAGTLIGSFLLGKHQREMKMEELEQKKEAARLQQQMLKIQLEAAKLKSEAESRKDAWLQKILGPELEAQPTASAPESQQSILRFGESFSDNSSSPNQPQPRNRLLDILGDPIKAAALKEATGVDFLGAGNLYARQLEQQRQWEEFMARERERAYDLYFKLNETHPPVTIEGEGGSRSVIYPRKYTTGETPRQPLSAPGLPQSGFATRPTLGGIPILPGVEGQPIPSGEKDNWVKIDPQTGTIVRPDFSRLTTPKQLSDAGYQYMTKEAQAAIGEFAGVKSILNKIESLMRDTIPTQEGALGRIPGAIRRRGAATLQTSPKLAELDALLKGTLAPMIRSLGEKGALANQDVDRALALMPEITDSGEVAWGKLQNVRDILASAERARLGSIQGKKNEPTQTQSGGGLPPEAVRVLREGVVTKFRNGQSWTLKNGVPTRVE